MEFDPSPLVQLAYNPMMSRMYGYGAQTKVTRTPARVKTEYIRNVVNNEAIKEVAKSTPDSTATSKATDTPVNTSTTANSLDIRAGMLADLYPNGIPAVNSTNISNNSLSNTPPNIGETHSAYLLRTTGNPGYMENTDVWDGTQFVKTKEFGGSTDSSSVNEYGDLQKFMGGGDEDPSIPSLTEADMYGTDSKDTTDAYMPQAQYGGYGRQLIQNYFPANLSQRRTYSQLTKGPYNSKTGEVFSSIPGFNPNAVIKDIKVTKKGVFGRPKQYSVTYNNNPSGKPEDRLLAHSQLIPSVTPKEEIRSLFGNKEKGTNLDPWARSDQRKNDRWEAQRKRQGYVEDTGETPMSNEEYMKLYKASLPVSNANYMQNYNADKMANKALEDKREAEYMQHYNETRNPYLHDPNNDNPYMQDAKAAAEGKGLFNPNSVNIPRQMATDELTEDGLPTDYYAYGGAYDLPEALLGAENPVSLENNPANGDLEPMKPLGTENAMKELRAQSEERNKGAYQPDEYTVDYDAKTKRYGDNQADILTFNAGVRGVTGMIDRAKSKKQEAAMYDNMNADNLYASDPSRDRGDYDTNSGLYRPNEQGQMWNSRSKQYGGPIYEDGGYVEGSEVFMDDDELNEFLANGGEVEYI